MIGLAVRFMTAQIYVGHVATSDCFGVLYAPEPLRNSSDTFEDCCTAWELCSTWPRGEIHQSRRSLVVGHVNLGGSSGMLSPALESIREVTGDGSMPSCSVACTKTRTPHSWSKLVAADPRWGRGNPSAWGQVLPGAGRDPYRNCWGIP